MIDILGNSLLLDDLLPEGPVAVGQTWKPADKVVAALLGLDAASRCDVQCVLKEVTDAVARFELAGQVEGPVNDTTARIQLKGKYRFDLRTGRIDWFALLSKEDRGISQVADGFEVVVRLQMTITPEEPSPELAEAKLATVSDLEPTPERTQLCYQSPGSRWRIIHDRRWYLGSDDRDVAVLKRIDKGTLIGQCNASSLAQRDPDKLVSLEEFQEDVRQALGENFGEFVEASQSVNAAKHRVLRVVVHGVVHNKSADVPIRWIYYHVADQQGRQAALTFTSSRSTSSGSRTPTSRSSSRCGSPSRRRRIRDSDRRWDWRCDVRKKPTGCNPWACGAHRSSLISHPSSLKKANRRVVRGEQRGGVCSDFPPIATGCVAARRAKVRRASALAVTIDLGSR